MKLLIVTQAVDTEDPVLGFFVSWLRALAPRFEKIEVICLKEGKHDLPANVRVHSLGKEKGRPVLGSLTYALRFKRLTRTLRDEYDAVFVHMNQEYVLLGGLFWKRTGKPVYLWRNHYAGSILTDIAAAFCTKVFCTSKRSYTAKYKKTVLMPVGVDLERFSPSGTPVPNSILYLARMSSSKRPEILLEAIANTTYAADFVGSPLPADEGYYAALKKNAPSNARFLPAVPNTEAPALYRSHQVFVNTSPSGMLDKTIFEAAACGAVVLAASEDWKEFAGEEYSFTNAKELAERLKTRPSEATSTHMRSLAEKHSLSALGDKLAAELSR